MATEFKTAAERAAQAEKQDLLSLSAGCFFLPQIAVAQADYIRRHYQNCPEGCLLAMLCLEHKLLQGDVCIRLAKDSFYAVLEQWKRQLSFTPEPAQFEQAAAFLDYCRKILRSCNIPAQLRQAEFVGSDTDTDKLLILSQNRLYFRRYFLYECQAASFISRQAGSLDEAMPAEQEQQVALALNELFPAEPSSAASSGSAEVNWQKVAAAMVTLKDFTVISGGPGTGKTTTLTKILLLLLALSPGIKAISLAAPTGKAAARMGESITRMVSDPRTVQTADSLAKLLECSCDGATLLQRIPRQAQTVHKLLRVVPHKAHCFYNADNPLPCEILVIDEVSMVDLALFGKLIAAIPAGCKVILLGDKDQLCSVEAGSVLSDIASGLQQHGSAEHKAQHEALLRKLSALCGTDPALLQGEAVSDNMVLLQKSWRFKADSGIGRLSREINSSWAEGAAPAEADKEESLLHIFSAAADLTFMQVPETSAREVREFAQQLVQQCLRHDPAVPTYHAFLHYLQQKNFVLSDEEVAQAFALMDRFRLLCSNKNLYLGEKYLNSLLENSVRDMLHLSGTAEYFPGRIVLVNKNDAMLRVHNGDVGFVAFEKTETGGKGPLRVFFPDDGENRIMRISPLLLHDTQSGFCMTVHKSQGSEYEHVLMVLSEEWNPVLTRELIYTGVTRAKKKLTVVSRIKVLTMAACRQVQRESGLSLRLQQAGPVAAK